MKIPVILKFSCFIKDDPQTFEPISELRYSSDTEVYVKIQFKFSGNRTRQEIEQKEPARSSISHSNSI